MADTVVPIKIPLSREMTEMAIKFSISITTILSVIPVFKVLVLVVPGRICELCALIRCGNM